MKLAPLSAGWSTPLVADACVRLGLPLRVAPGGLRPVAAGMRCYGPVRPAQHVGSVDVFLEAIELAGAGEVLVVDDGGRTDRACVGDLTALEALGAGLVGLVVHGAHRDTAELTEIGLPTFSYGAHPAGPTTAGRRAADALERVSFGDWHASVEDVIAVDADGAVCVAQSVWPDVVRRAAEIGAIEREQAARVGAGESLRDQLAFREYLARCAEDPDFGFREHLRSRGGAIEE